MWTQLFRGLLSALRLFARSVLFALFFQDGLIARALRHFNATARAILHPVDEQTVLLLRWLSQVCSVRVTSLEQVWRRGWLVCEAIDGALPGACAGHRASDVNLEHAQSLAEQYFGVQPVFSFQELESPSLTKGTARRLSYYLENVRQAIAKMTPPASKPNTPTDREPQAYTLDYVARGMGLLMAQINRKASFKIHPTEQQCLDPGEVYIAIHGPHGTCGHRLLKPIYGRAQLLRQAFLGANSEYTQDSLPITQGATYMRTYGKNDMKKTFHIPKPDIEIDVNVRRDYIHVTYTPTEEGVYEIYITSRGYDVVGSPFRVTSADDSVDSNTSCESLEADEERTESQQEKNDRKVVFRIVDFVHEKMILNENGSFQKITDEEAITLMNKDKDSRITATENEQKSDETEFQTNDDIKKQCHNGKRFKVVAHKVIKIIRICRYFKDGAKQKTDALEIIIGESETPKTSIPDIVNSMIFDKFNIVETEFDNLNERSVGSDITLTEFLPEINVGKHVIKKDEIQFPTQSETISRSVHNCNNHKMNNDNILHFSNPFLFNLEICDTQDTKISDRSSNRNPFIDDFIDKQTYVSLNNAIKIVAGNTDDATLPDNYSNIFFEIPERPKFPILITDNTNDSPVSRVVNIIETVKRPKTPVLKIITDNAAERPHSPFAHPDNKRDNSAHEYLNPFYVSKIYQNVKAENLPDNPKIDFKIGAPVSTIPQDFVRPQSTAPDLDSIILSPNTETALDKYDRKVKNMEYTEAAKEEIMTAEPITPIHEKIRCGQIYSNDCNEVETSSHGQRRNEVTQNARRDIWDSAYVSTDENIDTNNDVKNVLRPLTLKELAKEDVLKMGPAELEIWHAIGIENGNIDERTGYVEAIDNQRSIIDENISKCMAENETFLSTFEEERTIAVAMTELNDIYEKYLNTDDNNIEHTGTNEKGKYESIEVHFTLHQNNSIDVNSASEKITDVKRRNTTMEAAQISEVQSATESAASRVHDSITHSTEDLPFWDDQKMFGNQRTNFVKERKKYWDKKIQTLKELRDEEERKWEFVFKERKLEHKVKKEKTNSFKSIEAPVKYGDKFIPSNENSTDDKLVDKWKRYWDERTSEHENLLAAKAKVHDELLRNCKNKLKKNNLIEFNVNEDSKQVCGIVTNEKKPRKEGTIAKNIISITPGEIDTINFVNGKTSNDVYVSFNIKLNSSLNLDVHKVMKKSLQASNQKSENEENSSEIEPLISLDGITSNTPDIKLEQETDEDKLFEEFETNPKRFFGRSRTFFDKFEPTDLSKKDEKVKFCLQTPSIRGNIISNRLSIFNNIGKNIKDIPKKYCTRSELPETTPNEPVIINENTNMPKSHKECSNSEKNDKEIIICEDADVLTPRPRRDFFKEKYLNAIDSYEKDVACDAPKISYEKDLEGMNIIRKRSVSERYLNKISGSNDGHFDPSIRSDSTEANEINSICECREQDIVSKNENVEIQTTHTDNNLSKFTKATSKSKIELLSITKQYSDIEKHKSCVDLLNIRVKNYISLFENTSKSSPKKNPIQKDEKSATKIISKNNSHESTAAKVPQDILIPSLKSSLESAESALKKDVSNLQSEVQFEELVRSNETEPDGKEYRERFYNAKNFFETLEKHDNKSKSFSILNECEILLVSESRKDETNEHSPDVKKESESNAEDNDSIKKLAKISDKFEVEDLFNDVAGDGKISRQGSFRGIPNKQAVLATFQSMQNVADHKTSYEMSETEMTYVDKDTKLRDIQTYSTEYPYLPETDPSKVRSRIDNKAYGLISRKELVEKEKRRNSLPEALKVHSKLTTTM